jgi:hypothetical protein
MTLNRRAFVDDVQLLAMSRNRDVRDRQNADDGESCAFRLPALGTTTSVVMHNVAGQRHFDFVGGAFAKQLAAGNAGAGLNAIIEQGVKMGCCHVMTFS